MTYCIGWKRGNDVFLLADTVLTSTESINYEITSIGEHSAAVQDRFVQEGAHKLVVIAPGVAAAIAGHAGLALEICRFIRDNFDETQTSDAIVKTVEASFGPFVDRDKHFEFLLARGSATGKASLTKWQSWRGIWPKSDFYEIGSLRSHHAQLTAEFIFKYHTTYGNVYPADFLSMVLATVQSYGIRDVLLNQGVGGLITGLYVSNGKLEWQPLTIYTFHDKDFKHYNLTISLVENNCLVVSSTFTNRLHVYGNSVNATNLLDNVPPGFGAEIKLRAENHRWGYWFFFGTTEPRITIIKNARMGVRNRYARMLFPASGPQLMQIGVSNELAIKLRSPIPPEVLPGLPAIQWLRRG
jgi:hypothetical protein